MDGFLKIPGVIKNLLIEIFIIFLLPVTLMGVINAIFPGTFPAHHSFDSELDWVYAVVGPLLTIWLLVDIFQPKVKTEEWVRIGKFKFCSTHPSYVLYDAIAIAFALFLLWIGRASDSPPTVFWFALGTAVLIPLTRLFAWYGLGLKIHHPETADAYQPALWMFLIFAVIFCGAAIRALFN